MTQPKQVRKEVRVRCVSESTLHDAHVGGKQAKAQVRKWKHDRLAVERQQQRRQEREAVDEKMRLKISQWKLAKCYVRLRAIKRDRRLAEHRKLETTSLRDIIH
jgi:hypothetical protein